MTAAVSSPGCGRMSRAATWRSATILDQVYGTPLIALEFMLGTLVAWWSAR